MHDPGGTPSLSANIAVPIPATVPPMGGVPALGSSHPLADLDDRLFQARLHRGRLVTGHNIEVDGNGAADSVGGRNGVRWYEIVNLSGTPMLAQAGTLFDSAATNPRSYWMGSGAISGQGHIALAANAAAPDEYPQVAAALHLASEAAGTLGPPAIVQTATANCNDLMDQFNQHRWGDYSTMTVDPKDDMTFWTMQEYAIAPDAWAVRVIELKAPPPAIPETASPAALAQGEFETEVEVIGAAADGSGFFDPGPSFPNRLHAAVGGGDVTVHSVTWIDPTHFKMKISVAPSAAPGSRTVSVTNPDGQARASNGPLLEIQVPTDSDADGIPDWWMNRFFGHPSGEAGDKSEAESDADGDGFSNGEEFRARTDPTDPASAFRIVSVQREGTAVLVTFRSAAGLSYRLEAKTTVNAPMWETVTDNVAGGENQTVVTDPAAGSAKFYRVVLRE